MAQLKSLTVVFVGLLVLCAAAEAKKERKLGYYRSGGGGAPSGSSPVSQNPTPSYGSTPSGSSPVSQNPTPSYGSTPSSSSPVTIPPVNPVSPSTPSPVTIPPVSQTPSGGSPSGRGSCKFWGSNPGRVPKVLSLVSSLARIFGPRLLRVFSNHPTILSALKDQSNDAWPSLAREASASLINAYAYNDFPLRAADVVTQFNSALDSPQIAASQAEKFRQFNEAV